MNTQSLMTEMLIKILPIITRSFSDTEKDVLSDDDIERYENQETEGRNHASSDDDAQ